MDIISLLKMPEGKTLEFKRDLSSPTNIIKSTIAFANTAGGTLVIGIEDESHYIKGIHSPHDMEERIANILSDNIIPRVLPEIDIVPWRDTYLLAIRVFPSPSRPHYYKKQGMEKGTYVRVGSTNRKADDAIIQELRRTTLNETFDTQAMPELSSEAIDFRAASEQLSHIRKLTKADLESLEIITKHQGHKVPTVAGIILFGTDREKHFPDSWIQAGLFGGIDKTHILDSVEIHSYPIQAVEDAVTFVEKHARQSIEIGRTTHTKRWNLPMKAIRESIINAIVHADYSQQGSPIRIAIFDDRIEIENPGLLKFGLTISDIINGISKLRNRIIGRIFNLVGLIERWGSGIRRIINTSIEGGFPEPKFEEIGTHFRTTIYTQIIRAPMVDETNQAILKLLSADFNKGYTTAEIARHIELSNRATRTRLLKLIDLGQVVEIGSSAQDPNRQYFLAEQ